GKFDGKADEGYIVGYSTSNIAYRVYNVPNKRVEESMNMRFLEEKPNVQGLGHEWYFDLDYLTDTLGYKHVQANQSAGTQGATTNLAMLIQTLTVMNKSALSLLIHHTSFRELSLNILLVMKLMILFLISLIIFSKGACKAESILVPTGYIPVPAGATMISTDDVLVHTTFNVEVSPVATRRINKIHPQSLIIGDPTSAVQTKSKVKQTATGKYAIGTKWILKNKRDARGIVVRNKARLIAQGHRQEEVSD
nr:ribonuclease H-like domain-containing protein [Tanacetum cinerariifolium]